MRTSILILALLFLLCSCKEKKENCFSSFTFFKWNIHESYYLKFNSSETVYYRDAYPPEKPGIYYFLLEKSTRKELDSIVCGFKFPKDSVVNDFNGNDGTTLAFSIDKKRLMIHSSGPKEFWNFEKWLDSVQFCNHRKPINRKVKFESFDKMIPVPPLLTKVISKEQIIGIWETVGKELLTVDISKNQITFREHKESHKYKFHNDSINIYYQDFVQSGEAYFINDDTLVISTKDGELKYIKKNNHH